MKWHIVFGYSTFEARERFICGRENGKEFFAKAIEDNEGELIRGKKLPWIKCRPYIESEYVNLCRSLFVEQMIFDGHNAHDFTYRRPGEAFEFLKNVEEFGGIEDVAIMEHKRNKKDNHMNWKIIFDNREHGNLVKIRLARRHKVCAPGKNF